MTAAQEPLWADGWDLEPCGDAEPDPGPSEQPPPRWLRDTETVPIYVDNIPKGAPLMYGPPRQPLTKRQAEVLVAAADGAPLSEVARRVGTSREQVASRLSEAYKRLDVAWIDRDERRAAAVRVARKRGLIPAGEAQQARGSA